MPEQQTTLGPNAEFLRACYRGILKREPDSEGFRAHLDSLDSGLSMDSLLSAFVGSAEFMQGYLKTAGVEVTGSNEKFPIDYVPNAEAAKSYLARISSGFFAKYMGGDKILDIGFKGYSNPELKTVLPQAIGVDLDYPGYDGLRLPFDDGTIDCVFSSHCLEHIPSYKGAIRDWYRVTKTGGFIVCIVPSQQLYEKKRTLPSRYNQDHKRFYTPTSLLKEFEDSLEENSFRVRHLEENDRGYDYSIGPELHAIGCFEIVLVIEKIKKPAWALK